MFVREVWASAPSECLNVEVRALLWEVLGTRQVLGAAYVRMALQDGDH